LTIRFTETITAQPKNSDLEVAFYLLETEMTYWSKDI